MDIFIYASPGFGRPRDEIEDAIENFLGPNGEVTGGGAGTSGANIDIEIHEDSEVSESTIEELRRILAEFNVPQNTVIVVGGVKHSIY